MSTIFTMNTTKRTKNYLKSSLYLFPSEYISLDFETTGLDPELNEIIEIGAIKIKDNQIVDKFSCLIKPKGLISNYITELTGIDNLMVSDSKHIEDVLPSFLEFIGDDIILGQNVGFDLDFLYHALNRVNINKTFEYVDTLKLSLILLPTLSHHRLIDLVEYYEIKNELGFHRALADSLNTMKVYEKLKEDIISQYGSFENFLEEPYSNIDKKGAWNKYATSNNVKLVSNLKLREDIRNGDINYFTNKSGLDVRNREFKYDSISLDCLLHAYSQDTYTEIYEKPFREKKEIKTFLKNNNAILPNRKQSDTKMYITFSPIELSFYLKLKENNIDVCLSKDVIKFIRNLTNNGEK